MGWRDQFKAGWAAPPGTYQRGNAPPRREPPQPPPQWEQPSWEQPGWQDPPAAPAADPLADELAEAKTVIAGLMREIEERDTELDQRRAYIEKLAGELHAAHAALRDREERLTRADAAMARLAELEAALPELMAALQQAQADLARAGSWADEILLFPGVKAFLSKLFHPDLHGSSPDQKEREAIFKKLSGFYERHKRS